MRKAPVGRMPRLEKLAARYEFVTTFAPLQVARSNAAPEKVKRINDRLLLSREAGVEHDVRSVPGRPLFLFRASMRPTGDCLVGKRDSDLRFNLTQCPPFFRAAALIQSLKARTAGIAIRSSLVMSS